MALRVIGKSYFLLFACSTIIKRYKDCNVVGLWEIIREFGDL